MNSTGRQMGTLFGENGSEYIYPMMCCQVMKWESVPISLRPLSMWEHDILKISTSSYDMEEVDSDLGRREGLACHSVTASSCSGLCQFCILDRWWLTSAGHMRLAIVTCASPALEIQTQKSGWASLSPLFLFLCHGSWLGRLGESFVH